MQFFIEQIFQQDLLLATNQSKDTNEVILCKQLSYNNIIRKLNSYSDLFTYDENFYKESRELFKERM